MASCPIRVISFWSMSTIGLFVAAPAWAEEAANPQVSPWFVYLVIAIVLIGSLLTLAFIRTALSLSTWSLADALSEEVEVTATTTNADGTTESKLENGKAVMVTEMRASSSRLIALMGMMVILLMFIGFGVFSLHWFAFTGSLPEGTDDAIKFLTAGLTLFAPYVVNKFASLFESMAPKKS